ncbi:MAG: methylthioribulose 1-phosphate dehydratase [Desulfobacteraceae bacterium]|nr:methylthioribulose 1-phosphate dehydratase [Desulfobacteraceae bacterium]
MKQFLKNALKIQSLELIKKGRYINQKGWVPATSGNLSIRLSEQFIAITASGKHKGQLTQEDIMIVDLEGKHTGNKTPSAETFLHTTLYQMDTTINCVIHTHSMPASLLSWLLEDHLVIQGFEILKGLRDIHTHESKVTIPIFDNSQDISSLSKKILSYLQTNSKIYGYLLKGHGLYTWGNSLNEALRHLEVFEFLLELKHQQLLTTPHNICKIKGK